MNILHICAGWQKWNGAANIARMIMDEQRREGHEVSFATWAKVRELRAADEVWIHCGWLPCLWWAALVCFLTQRRRGAERILKWMPEACYDPVRLRYHGWKKWLVGPIERFFLRRCAKIVATCEAEKGWIEAYLGKRCPAVEVTDVKRFFRLTDCKIDRLTDCEVDGFIDYRIDRSGDYGADDFKQSVNPTIRQSVNSSLNLLYLGRRHPLKGVEYLEAAVAELNSNPVNPVQNSSTCSTCPTYPKNSAPSTSQHLCVRFVSNAFGEEKERVWDWCDVLVLPTLSDNFGLVIAEALERGKRVITTDGAPAWGEGNDYGGRLVFLKGFRDGTDEVRVGLLKDAIAKLVGMDEQERMHDL